MAMKRTLSLIAVFGAVAMLWAKPALVSNFRHVDLQSKANQKLAEDSEGLEGNNLKELLPGARILGGVHFTIGDGLIQLGSTVIKNMPDKVEGITVGSSFAKLHILHATCYGGGPNQEGTAYFVKDDTVIGEYRVNFEDKSSEIIPIVYGKDVRDWFYVDGEKSVSDGKIAWKGDNDFAKGVGSRIRLYHSTWENPHRSKKVVSIDYLSRKDDTVAAPFCVAMTLELK
jgi:hypothetical protein